MKYVYVGIDPGVRHIGIALVNGKGVPATKHLEPDGALDAIRQLAAQFQAICDDGDYQVRCVGVENYGFFGPRTGGYHVVMVVGAVLALAIAFGWQPYLFMPKEKEKVSSTINRPVGMTDHEFDAICVAQLAKVKHSTLKVRPNVKEAKGA